MKHTSLLAAALLLLLASCAPRPNVRVFLLEDDHGKTGAVSVSNAHGTQTVDQSGHAVALYGMEKPPGEPYQADRAAVEKDFEKVLEAVPPAPLVYTLYFKLGGTKLSGDSRSKIPEIVTAIKNRAIPRVGIIGHTDRSGNKDQNDRLSRKRSRSIRNLLVARGIPEEQIVEVTSHGENDPAVPTEDGVKEKRNRRVEIIIR